MYVTAYQLPHLPEPVSIISEGDNTTSQDIVMRKILEKESDFKSSKCCFSIAGY